MKVRYRRRRMEHAADLLDDGPSDLSENAILTAMRYLTPAWNDISKAMLQNCWETTGIVRPYDLDGSVLDNHVEKNVTVAVQKFVETAALSANGLVSVMQMLIWENDMECTRVFL